MTEPEPLPPLSRGPLREQIRRVLLDGLVAGRWQPGERIVERRVAAELDVSQAPVREALRELEALRLVESAPNKGARVRDFDVRDLRESYQVRAVLEGLAADLAVPVFAGDVRVLEEHTRRLHQAAAAGDVTAQIRHAVAFHRAIVAASDNRLLLAVWESLGVEVWTTLSLRVYRAELHENAEDHEPIVAAFRRQDPRTGEIVRDHVLSYGLPPAPAPDQA
ncbi:GntR family transcriptional regulator [Goodfellowiella coeruleoviolacea]|uniref:Transcriptional regulator, GntR family n=1 Tax=Goodfellowiella coeruleoviolacea TaxID=334858 RepID=A0AAE3KFU7_9PSEU|nr:GntR family transcriptional regulator [Goodfellowiella coeruleoviolacea]MCP2166716.1 transcriptional regulator, GntR family [Goodfellowiella coeruleoviolacea]